MTKRQGWLRPTEGERQAVSIKRSMAPAGSGSQRKRRTSRRHTNSSRKCWRKVSSNSTMTSASDLEGRGNQQDQDLACLLERAEDVAGLPADLADGKSRQHQAGEGQQYQADQRFARPKRKCEREGPNREGDGDAAAWRWPRTCRQAVGSRGGYQRHEGRHARASRGVRSAQRERDCPRI